LRTPEELLDLVVEAGATDLLLTVGAPPTLRVLGDLRPIDDEVLEPKAAEQLIRDFVPPERWTVLDTRQEVDFSIAWRDVARFRANAFMQRGHHAIALRMIPNRIPTPEELGLPASVRELATLNQGLILLTGQTGSGKSTTIASMLEWINLNRPTHIITIEDPIEYMHQHRRSIVEQREVGLDTGSFATALRSVLRQNPDVILVGEMRDLETIRAALTVAETGHLVFATLHTNDSAQAVNRIIDVFPSEQQQQIKVQLAHTLSAVIYQQLLPRKDRSGLLAAYEVLLATTAVRNLIREGQTRQIRNVIATSFQLGMRTLERSLTELVNAGVIDMDAAMAVALYPKEIGMANPFVTQPVASQA
jgi:twitching motility protein PilT